MGGISLNMDDGGIMGVSGGLGVAEEFPEEPNIPPPTGPAGPGAANECMQQPWPAHAAAAAAAIVGSAFMTASKVSSRLIK